jgi:Ca2+/Na+ antiporter
VAGVSGTLGPISGKREFLWQTLPYMLAATFLCFFLSRNRSINRAEGMILLIGYVLFVREVLLGVLS